MNHRAGPPTVRLVLGLVLAAALALGAVGAWVVGASDGGPNERYLPQPGPLTSDRSLGINADLSHYDADAMHSALSAMDAAGFRWLRHRFPWNEIEPVPGEYAWATWDALVQATGEHDLRLIAVLDGSPQWARAQADNENPLAPPVEVRDFGAFASAFASRYGDQIDLYQIWDEPNIAPHWGAREIDPASMAHLLREGAIQIRSADAGAVILAPALAPNVESGGANMSDVRFLEELYVHGGAEWFDVVAAQLYDLDGPPEAAADPAQLSWARATLLRDVMETHADADTAIWAVSAGLEPDDPDSLTAAVQSVRQRWPWMGPLLWAAWSPADAHGQYALLDSDGRRRPAYDALESLASAPEVAWPGSYLADHASGQYEGTWRVTPSGADIGRSGDRLSIPFWGPRLDLTVRRGDYRAFLFVTVDGQPANALPQDSEGQAYVVLYDPLRETDTVTLAEGLAEGYHVADIVAERGWGQWAIIGWQVFGGSRDGGPWIYLALGLGLAALVTLGIVLHRAWPYRYSLGAGLASFASWYLDLDDLLVLAVAAGVSILAYAVVGLLPSLAALGFLGGMFLLRPQTGLPLIAVALPFYQLGKPLMGKVFSMVEILTLLTAAGWFLNRLVAYGWGRFASGRAASRAGAHGSRLALDVSRLTMIDWGVIALLAVAALSLLWAEHARVAAREFRTVVLGAALFYALLRMLVRDRPALWRVADAWVLGGALVALVGLAQWALGANLISADSVSRVRGFYGSPNNLALYLGRILPLAVAVAAWSQRQVRKWAYALVALLIAAGILLTFSRGAWLLGVPAALLFLAAVRGRRSLAVMAGLLFLAAIVVLLIAGPGRLMSLLDMARGTTYFRLQLWQSSWAMLRDNPLLGVGLDNFLYEYRTHYVLPTAWEEFNLSHPHNLVLDAWLRLGLAGLVAVVFLIVAFFRRGWSVYRHLPESTERLLVLGLLGGMVYTVAHGLVDNALFLVDLGFAFTLMLALVQAAGDGVQYRTSNGADASV